MVLLEARFSVSLLKHIWFLFFFAFQGNLPMVQPPPFYLENPTDVEVHEENEYTEVYRKEAIREYQL